MAVPAIFTASLLLAHAAGQGENENTKLHLSLTNCLRWHPLTSGLVRDQRLDWSSLPETTWSTFFHTCWHSCQLHHWSCYMTSPLLYCGFGLIQGSKLLCEFNSCSARYVSPNQHSSDPGFPFPGKRAAQVVEEGSTCPLEWRRRQSNTRADYRWVASLCRSLFLFLSRISQTLFGAVNL